MSKSTRKNGHSSARLRLEALEGREVPATLVGLTTLGSLVTFDSATPGTLIGAPVAVTGLQTGETLVGIDSRPATAAVPVSRLYGVGSTSRLYTIDTTTGLATAVSGTAFTTPLSGTSFGVDFNPVPDRLRIVSNTGQSLRINPDTGAATNDTALFFDPNNDTNRGFYGTTNPNDPTSPAAVPGGPANIVAAAYTRNLDATTGSVVTTLYGIDPTQQLLVQIGGPDGTPTPNNGQVVAFAELRNSAFQFVNFNSSAGLDIEAGTDNAFASNGNAVFGIQLSTGTVLSGAVVGGGFSLTDLAIAPPPTAVMPGAFSLSANAFTFPANRGPVAVTVNRTGGTTGTVTINYATADGTAVAGVDYFPAVGTLTFTDGQTSRQIFLQVPPGSTADSPAKTFTLSLSNATGGATLGSTPTATVTIPAVVNAPTPTTPPTRFFAVGSTQNALVSVYNANGGALAFTFRAFEGTFRGEARVATGDVNGDGFDDIIVGAGPGAGPRVQVFDGKTLSSSNQTQLASFNAFDPGFVSGIFVSSGDVNGDGFADVVVGAGAGAGPHVKVFDGNSLLSGNVTELASFFAFDAGFVSGVNVGVGNINGDKFADVIVGAGNGGGSHVKVFDGQTISTARTELASFFAFDAGFVGGIFVSGGDFNSDGRTDVIVGAGNGGGSHVKIFDGRTISTARTELASFFAFDAGFLGGISTSSRDLNRDGADDLIVGAGRGGQSHVSYFDGLSLISGRRRELGSFFAIDQNFNGGVYVG